MTHDTKNFRPIVVGGRIVMINPGDTVAYCDDIECAKYLIEALEGVPPYSKYSEYEGIPCTADEVCNYYPALEAVVGDIEAFCQEVEHNKVLFASTNSAMAVEYYCDKVYLIAPFLCPGA